MVRPALLLALAWSAMADAKVSFNREIRPILSEQCFSCHGFGAAKDPVHVRDIHATLLHQMGLNHERLSVRSQGLDVRLTGVNPAKVLKPLLA